MAYSTAKVTPTIFDEWVAAVSALFTITSKKKELQEFIDYTAMMVEDRTLYKSRTSIWRTQPGATFSFVPIRNDIKTVFSGTVDLTYSSGTGNNSDESTIYGTTGLYYFLTNTVEGKGGRLTWERCGMAKNACYADLEDYSAVVKFPKFTADSVTFINTNYFKTPIKGVVEEALNTKTEPDKYNFPEGLPTEGCAAGRGLRGQLHDVRSPLCDQRREASRLDGVLPQRETLPGGQ